MAKLRKGVAYRKLERPYTRRSKYRALNYVRASPHNLIVRYDMGDFNRNYEYKLELVSDQNVQLRHNCIESARKTANKLLETKLNKAYAFKIRMFPHHVLRENPLASGAGADRMSTGMTMSFGKPIGIAAQVKKGKPIMELLVDEKDLATAKEALHRAQTKFPMHCMIRIAKVAQEQ
jgi:large subunit ribosomal protein L10e